MTEALNASRISTHYYKLAHISSLKYSIYTTNGSAAANDQSLLELELSIRFQHPKILITYYNKCLYHFALENGGEDSNNLVDLFPQLQLKHSTTTQTEILTNPAKYIKSNGADSEYLAYASLCFVKAVKKLVLYNLSLTKAVQLFGNYAVVNDNYASNSIIYIDPILLPNGDLMISVTINKKLALYNSSLIGVNDFDQLDPNFIIYLIPSGIRCHLYDINNISQSFTYNPPKNGDNLTSLLKLSTGIDLTSDTEEILWVKLIPNLQHLNNQTSKISKFIHLVDNKKFILWPWKLCLLQFGHVELSLLSSMFDNQLQFDGRQNKPDHQTDNSDPLSLISDLMDFNISNHRNRTTSGLHQSSGSYTNPPFSVPSAMSTGVSSSGNINESILKNDESGLELHDGVPVLFNTPNSQNVTHDIFKDAEIEIGDQNFGPLPKETSEFYSQGDRTSADVIEISDKEVKEEPKEDQEEDEEEEDMDDLFGHDSDEESEKKEEQTETSQEVGDDVIEVDNDPVKLDEIAVTTPDQFQESISNDENTKTTTSNEDEPSAVNETSSSKKTKIISHSYIDIPKDQMTMPSFRNFNATPQVYDDPGAPLPVIPTPMLPQSGANTSTFTASGSINYANLYPRPPGSAPAQPPHNPSDLDEKSIFSPIVFNPIIRSNIDTKYGKGGKFYVDKESSTGNEGDLKKRKLRATSVSGYEYPVKKDLRNAANESFTDRGLGIGVDDKQDISDMAIDVDDEENQEDDDLVDDDYDEEEEEEESDEDEEDRSNEGVPGDRNSRFSPPLKLNTLNEAFGASNAVENNQKLLGSHTNTGVGAYSSPLSNFATSTRFNPIVRFDSPSSINSGNFNSDNPNFNMSMASPSTFFDTKPYSTTSTNPPATYHLEELNDFSGQESSDQIRKDPSPPSSGNTPSNTSPSKTTGITESSNCLPLILRGINVVSIPNIFLLNNISGSMSLSTVPSDFNMDVDEEENDFEINKNNELMVKINHLDELLKWLGLNLIFDLGLNKFENYLRPNTPQTSLKKPDDVNGSNVDGVVPGYDFEKRLMTVFPLCYRVSLNEFVNEFDSEDSQEDSSSAQEELTNQLSFLDDITNDDILNPKSQLKKLNSIQWDSIYTENAKNRENFHQYKAIVENFNRSSPFVKNDDEHLFQLGDDKSKVLKHENEIVNLNSIGLRFWKYLNFSPLHGPKNFQVALVSENSHFLANNYNLEFLNSLIYNYNESHFGNITKLTLESEENRPDFESIHDGLLLVNRNEVIGYSYNEVYKKINKQLLSLVELIRLDIIHKTNRFEFDRPLLLLFVNFDDSINSMLQISKICRNFKLCLTQHQLPLVDVFTHVLPSSYIFKQTGNQRNVRYLSNFKLSKLSKTLYNKCPNSIMGIRASPSLNRTKELSKSLYTNLVRAPPTKLQFKFLNNNGKDGNSSGSNDEIFLHLAYERSVDKNWIAAAWSDPLGITTHTKSWYSSAAAIKNHKVGTDVHDIGAVADEIWDISNELFKKLNAEVIKRTSGLGGKKFLVLTRVNSIIPDDELVHWKRLSVKHKDVSLIVLSVNRFPKMLFTSDNSLAHASSSENSSNDANNLMDEGNDDNNNNSGSNASNNGGFSTVGATAPGSVINSAANTVIGQPRTSLSATGSTALAAPIAMSATTTANALVAANNVAPSGMGSATTPSAPGSAPDFFKTFNNFPTSSNSSPTTTGATMFASPSNNGGINFHSPQQFLNAPGNFLSPHDLVSSVVGNNGGNGHGNGRGIINEADLVIHNADDDIMAVIPRVPLPSFTSPSRLGMKVGYLLKESDGPEDDKKYLVYEVTLLSCSNFWKLDAIMKIVLQQFKKLITLKEILGIDSNGDAKSDSSTQNHAGVLIPWHVHAVGRLLDYLVHIAVEE